MSLTTTVITSAYWPHDISGYLASHATCTAPGGEWIVLDGGSYAGLDNFFERLAQIGAHVIHCEANAGQRAARNFGLSETSGK